MNMIVSSPGQAESAIRKRSVDAARLRAFAQSPAPQEVAEIVASWRPGDQAALIGYLGAALRARYGVYAPWAREAIGHALAIADPKPDGVDLVIAIAGVVHASGTPS